MTPDNAQILAYHLMKARQNTYEYYFDETPEAHIYPIFKNMGKANPLTEEQLRDLLLSGKQFSRMGLPTNILRFLLNHLFQDDTDYTDYCQWVEALNLHPNHILNAVQQSSKNQDVVRALTLDLSHREFECDKLYTSSLNNIAHYVAHKYRDNTDVQAALYSFIFAHTEKYWGDGDFSSLCETLIEAYPEDLEKYNFLPEVAQHLENTRVPKLWGENIEHSLILPVDLKQFKYLYHLPNYKLAHYQSLLELITSNLDNVQAGIKHVACAHTSEFSLVTALLTQDSTFTQDHLKQAITACFNMVKNNASLAQFPDYDGEDTDDYMEEREKMYQALKGFSDKYFFNLHLHNTLPEQPTQTKKFKL